MTNYASTMTVEFDSVTFRIGTPTTVSQSADLPIVTATTTQTFTQIMPMMVTSTAIVSSTVTSSPSITTITSEPATTSSKSAHKSSGPSAGQTTGIIIGSVLGAVLLMFLIFLFCWRRKKKHLTEKFPPMAADNTDNHSNTSEGGRRIFNTPSRQQDDTTNPTTNRRSWWPRHVNPEEIGIAVIPTERQGFLKRMTNPAMRSRTVLPISAPIPEARISIQESFHNRFFAEPTPITSPPKAVVKHVSDATTIRTSCNPPTPARPSLLILRPWSTVTSIATSFEEDRDYQDEDIPPVPTFNAADYTSKSISVKREHNTPSQSKLEAGIKNNVHKALSTMSWTPNYDNGNVDVMSPPRVAIFSRSRSRLINAKEPPKTQPPPAITLNSLISQVRSSPPPDTRQWPPSPESPYPDIPDRQSSLPKDRLYADEEWLLQDSTNQPPSESSKPKVPRPPPLQIKKFNEPSHASPISNLTYPRIPISASEGCFGHTISALKTPLNSRPITRVPVASKTAQSRTPMPRTVTTEDPHEGPSKRKHIAKQFQPPAKIYIPAEGQGILQVYSPSDFNTVPPPKATLTPNRTNTGDLVLTVNL